MNRICPTCDDVVFEDGEDGGESFVPLDDEEPFSIVFCSEECRRDYIDHRFDLPDDIKIRVAITDPNVHDGEPLYHQYVLTEKTLEMFNGTDEEYMRNALQQVGDTMARGWAEEREEE